MLDEVYGSSRHDGTVLFDLGGLLWCEWKEGIATG